MAFRYFGSSATDVFENITISEEHPNCVSVTCTPALKIIEASMLYPAEKEQLRSTGVDLMFIDGSKNSLSINPLSTTITQSNFLKAKYRDIQSITLEGFSFKTPENEDDLQDLLQSLPTGFVKDYQYGLGLVRELSPIIHTISDLPNVDHLVISTTKETCVENNFYILSYDDFEEIRLTLNRIISRHQSSSRMERYLYAHNTLLTTISPKNHPYKKKPYKKNAVSDFTSETNWQDNTLSKRDSSAIVDLLKTNKEAIYKNSKEKFADLQFDFNLINIENVLKESEKLFHRKRSSEDNWQDLLNENPMILPLVFGYPVIKIQDQASVGGRTFSGRGDKITDFLVKNKLTNNLAIIEIKKPATALMKPGSYRDSVHAVTNDLAGAVAQILDQKYKLQKEIASLKENSRIYDIETYAVECVLLMGTMPTETDQIKSFEQFRSNLQNLKIVTFDELIQKLKDIYKTLQHVNSQNSNIS